MTFKVRSSRRAASPQHLEHERLPEAMTGKPGVALTSLRVGDGSVPLTHCRLGSLRRCCYLFACFPLALEEKIPDAGAHRGRRSCRLFFLGLIVALIVCLVLVSCVIFLTGKPVPGMFSIARARLLCSCCDRSALALTDRAGRRHGGPPDVARGRATLCPPHEPTEPQVQKHVH